MPGGCASIKQRRFRELTAEPEQAKKTIKEQNEKLKKTGFFGLKNNVARLHKPAYKRAYKRKVRCLHHRTFSKLEEVTNPNPIYV